MNHVEYNGKRFEIKNNSLSLKGQNITDISKIKGLENQLNLISLNLNDNRIEKIHNLNKLANLEKLHLNNNQLTEISGLESLINLKVLSLGSNKIKEIKNISHLVNLEDLFIEGNRIKKIEGLNAFQNLRRLNLSYNRIRKIEGLSHLKNLYSLFLGSNRIKSIENLEKLENLNRLGLSANRICEIKGMGYLYNLEHLDLNFNNIIEIKKLKMLLNLRILKLSHNYISEIKGLDSLKISSLELSNNYIEEVKGFEDLNNLTNLNLQNNPIMDQEEFLLNRTPDIVVEYCKEKKKSLISEIGDKEGQTIEYKETYRWDVRNGIKNNSLKSEVSKTICAFMNSNGGNLFLGVDDDGNIKGIENDLKTYNNSSREKNKDLLHQDIKNIIKEHLGSSIINKVTIEFIYVKSIEIIKVVVTRSLEPVFINNKEFIVRNGPASQKLEGKDIYDYIVTHFNYGPLDEDYEWSGGTMETKPKLKLINEYLFMFERNEISPKNYESRINSIIIEIRYISDTEEESIRTLIRFIDFINNLLKSDIDIKLKKKVLSTLFALVKNPNLAPIIKENCYDNFSNMYENGTEFVDLVRILFLLGYFDSNLSEELVKAIKTQDLVFLHTIELSDLSKINDDPIELIKILHSYTETLDYETNRELINYLEIIISKLEQVIP